MNERLGKEALIVSPARVRLDEQAPVRAGGLAHARRKFGQALEAGDARAAVALTLSGQVYAVERAATAQGDEIAERLAHRRQPPVDGPSPLSARGWLTACGPLSVLAALRGLAASARPQK